MTMTLSTALTLCNNAARGNLKSLRDLLIEVSNSAIAVLSGVVAGTAAAGKAIVTDTNNAVSGLLSLSATTLIGNLRITRNAPVAAAGTTVTDAAQLSAGFTVVTGANGTVGVKLPATPAAGTIVIIKGTTAGVLKVWPDAAATINAVGSNGALSLASGAIPAIFIADSPTQWYSLPLVAS